MNVNLDPVVIRTLQRFFPAAILVAGCPRTVRGGGDISCMPDRGRRD